MTDAHETEVRRIEQARAVATLRGDTTSLRSMLDADLLFAHSTGGSDTRTSLLAKLSNGDFAYSAYEFEPDRVVADGTVAIVTGRLRATLDAFGRTVHVDSTVTDVWLRRPRGLRLLAVLSHTDRAAAGRVGGA